MSYRFKVVFEQEADGGYSVHVPGLPGSWRDENTTGILPNAYSFP